MGLGFSEFCLAGFWKGHLAHQELAAVYFLAHLVHDQQRHTGRDDAQGHDTHGLAVVFGVRTVSSISMVLFDLGEGKSSGRDSPAVF